MSPRNCKSPRASPGKDERTKEDVDAAAAVRKAANDKFVATQESLAALAERARREQAVAAAKDAIAAPKPMRSRKSELAATTSELNDRWSKDFTIARSLLTPEQMCWTVPCNRRLRSVLKEEVAARQGEADGRTRKIRN
jgi:hypothetical protein